MLRPDGVEVAVLLRVVSLIPYRHKRLAKVYDLFVRQSIFGRPVEYIREFHQKVIVSVRVTSSYPLRLRSNVNLIVFPDPSPTSV